MTALMDVVGVQTPRIEHVPDTVATTAAGDEAIDFAELIGITLDPWQQRVLRTWLGETPDGSWAASSCALVMCRQNGKNLVTAIRQLAGLTVFGEPKHIHSAHEFATSMEHMALILELVERSPKLKRQYVGKKEAHGSEQVMFKGGTIRFKTRTRTGTRGFSRSNTVTFDEAFEIPEPSFNSLRPTITAQPNHQLIYTSSAVNQVEHPHGYVLTRIRQRALDPEAGDRLAYAEWSVDEVEYAADPVGVAADPRRWAQGNPSLGFGRITAATLQDALREMGAAGFAAEHLGVGDWPSLNTDVDDDDGFPIGEDDWSQLADREPDPESRPMLEPVVLGLHQSPDRASNSICAAGWRADGRILAEHVETLQTTTAAVSRLRKLMGRNPVSEIVVDGYSGLADLLHRPAEAGGIADLLEAGRIKVRVTGVKEMAQACGRLIDLCSDRTLVHLDQPALNASRSASTTRPLGGGVAWKPKADGDITPWVAATLAVYGVDRPPPPAPARQPMIIVT